jgi:hypothetical protein
MTIAHALALIRFATGCSNGGYESETMLSFICLATENVSGRRVRVCYRRKENSVEREIGAVNHGDAALRLCTSKRH